MRETLVRTRSMYISLIGALARREGCRIKAGPSPSFARRVEQAGLPAQLKKRFKKALDLSGKMRQVRSRDARWERKLRTAAP